MAALAEGSPFELSAHLDRLWREPRVRAACAQFSRLEPWIRRRQIEASAIAAPTGLEGLRAEWMMRQFLALGWAAEMDEAGNVVAQRGPAFGARRRRAPLLALTAHLDTAFPAGTPVQPRLARGRLHGPGIGDNAAGLAALLALARVLAEGEFEGELGWALVATTGEEGEGNLRGMRHLFERSPLRHQIAYSIVVDGPGGDEVTVAGLAGRRLRVSFAGPGGHSWADAGAASAVHALGRAMAAVLAAAPPLPGVAACGVSAVEGGGAINAVAARAAMKLDLRASDPARLEEMTRAVRRAVATAVAEENRQARAGRIAAHWETLGERPWGELAPGSRLLTALRRVNELLGAGTHARAASTDANIPLALGREAIRLGAGGRGGGAHSLTEWFDPSGRELALRRLLLLCLSLARCEVAA